MNRPLAPYLSIILAGRNDDRGSDLVRQMAAAVSYNHRLLVAAGVDYELVFVEWRPVRGRVLLSELLRQHVSEVGSRLTTYEVDQRYHDAFSQNAQLESYEFLARNVGIRRASGSYVLVTSTDICLSSDIVNMLMRQAPRPMVLYRATCVDLRPGLDTTELSEGILAHPSHCAAINVLSAPYLPEASRDFLLLDRFSFHALGGFNEVFRVAETYIDANFCYRAHAQGLLILDTRMNVFRLGDAVSPQPHYPACTSRVRRVSSGQKEVLYKNPANWGLGDAPITERRPGHLRLEFDERAVPPMVALQRVVRRAPPPV